MNNLLKTKYSYLSNFLEEILSSPKQNIANSLIFYGSDILAQYYFALSLAKSLNCLKNREDNCDCVNCNWIKENKHPAVLTISKIDNKSDDSKTVISKQQLDLVKDSLVNSSSYHRVFVFCDAEYKVLTSYEAARKKEFEGLDICLPETEREESWYPKGLTRACFQDVAANSLLKSIEEPPDNVTFIFLTEDKDDLIQTIISRSQSFFVPNFSQESIDAEFLNEFLQDYPNLKTTNALKFSKFLLDYQNKNDIASVSMLNSIQEYLKQVLVANKDNKILFYKALDDIKKIQLSKKMIACHIKDSLVYDELAFNLCNQD